MPPQAASGWCLATDDLSTPLSVGLWLMLAAVLGLAGTYLAVKVKQWARREQAPEAFTLQDLREMRARCEISEAEFESLRAALLARSDLGVHTADACGDEESLSDASPEPPNDE